MFWLFWFLCGIGAIILGIQKGANPFSIFTGFLLGPIGLLSAILTKSIYTECPYCKEKVKEDAIICPHCKKELSGKI